MLKDQKALEYTLLVIKVMDKLPETDSLTIFAKIEELNVLREPSASYLRKLLSKLASARILESSGGGYTLRSPVEEITIGMVLEVCDMPIEQSPVHNMVLAIKEKMYSENITKYLNL